MGEVGVVCAKVRKDKSEGAGEKGKEWSRRNGVLVLVPGYEERERRTGGEGRTEGRDGKTEGGEGRTEGREGRTEGREGRTEGREGREREKLRGETKREEQRGRGELKGGFFVLHCQRNNSK